MLEAKNLKKRYKKRYVVDGVSLELSKGEVVGLLGPNGAGKTTTFYMIVGIIKSDGGEIYYKGENITGLPIYKRASLGIGYLPQEISVFRKLTVYENIYAAMEFKFKDKKIIEERTERLIEEFGLNHVRDTIGYALSGGEKRRVEIARCLSIEPEIILLDEPFAGIDPISVQEIQKMIERLKKMGIGILITDHNVRETLQITDRAYIMYQGKILTHGDPDKIINDEKVKKTYLGEGYTI
ncbi:ABC transporter, ATP-binding protein [Deferribacter desulfuricans SSM1]|uniref:ABC transporter, ATP-binding protein n=1 Tax=Deferribacter desulfuricans (strain DSM 14783 / JCM 11476 / NBRC 101012 / SSM1) TaxID=639282 RepID=D3PD40_DEFDS|nr:LPS export ABC transporter ATP-binding protein [Deferribacter desulfuricans]BAI80513.1 ABC transporter, ATP-binding protein [Deferribacter desulfuricans SSM1]